MFYNDAIVIIVIVIVLKIIMKSIGSVVGLSGLATSETTNGLAITSHKKLNILEVTLKPFWPLKHLS